jgi:hypothetical protein
MSYTYQDPREQGFRSIKMNYNEIKFILPYYTGQRWTSRADVWYRPKSAEREEAIIIETVPGIGAWLIGILGAPLFVVLYGVGDWAEAVGDLYKAKERGKFCSDRIVRRPGEEDLWNRVEVVLRNRGEIE